MPGATVASLKLATFANVVVKGAASVDVSGAMVRVNNDALVVV